MPSWRERLTGHPDRDPQDDDTAAQRYAAHQDAGRDEVTYITIRCANLNCTNMIQVPADSPDRYSRNKYCGNCTRPEFED